MRVYLASTPYHLLLIGALQVGNDDASAYVLYDDEYGFLRRAGDIEAAFPNVMLRVLPPFEQSSRLGRVTGSRKSAAAIIRQVNDLTGRPDLFICTATRTDALRAVHRLGNSVELHFIEDGLDAYLPHGTKPNELRDGIHYLAARVANGFPPPKMWDNTTTMEFASFHVMFPEIARDTIPRSKIEQIEERWFRTSVGRLSAVTDAVVPPSRPTDVWFPSHSDYVGGSASLLSSIERWSSQIQREDPDRIGAVKLHPRETDEVLLSGVADLGIVHFPSWLPAELLVHHLDSHCRIRMGLSTFVLSSKILVPNRTIYLDESVNREFAAQLTAWDDSIIPS